MHHAHSASHHRDRSNRNHQTHHRGQITAMLRQTGCPYPELDMHRVMIPALDSGTE